MLVFAMLAVSVLQGAPSEDTKKALQGQQERAGVVADRGAKAHYTQKFDVSGLPHYVPSQKLTGWIRLHGSNYLSDGSLGSIGCRLSRNFSRASGFHSFFRRRQSRLPRSITIRPIW